MAYERAHRLLETLRLDLHVLSSHDLISLYPEDVHSLDYPLHLSINDSNYHTATLSRVGTAEFRSLKFMGLSVLSIGVFTASQRKLGSTRLTLDLNSHRWKHANLTVRSARGNFGGSSARLSISYRVKPVSIGDRIVSSLFENNNNRNRNRNHSRPPRGTSIRTTTCVSRVIRVPRDSRREVRSVRPGSDCGCDNNENSVVQVQRVPRPCINGPCNHEPGCRCDSSESCRVCENYNSNCNRARRIREHDDLLADCLQEARANSRFRCSRSSNSRCEDARENSCDCC